MSIRYDSGTLGKPRKTPQGGLRVPAALTRTGLFTYHTPSGPRVEYRPEQEVFHADSLETLRGAVVTNDHPAEMVTTDNYKSVTVGNVSDSVEREDDKIVAAVLIQDKSALSAVEKGKREVSCGYTCDLEMVGGMTPEGQRYDAIQRNIRYNHVALVSKGRAGSKVALRLDAQGNQCFQPMEPMKIEIINGVEFEVGSEAHRKAKAGQADTERKDAAELQRLKDLEKDLPALVHERASLLARAQQYGLEVSPSEEKLDVLVKIAGHVLPDTDFGGRSEAYIEGALDHAATRKDSATSDVEYKRALVKSDTRERQLNFLDEGPDAIARKAMLKGTN